MAAKRGNPAKKRPRDDTRLKTDLPFEDAVRCLLNTPPPRKEPPPPQSENPGESYPE